MKKEMANKYIVTISTVKGHRDYYIFNTWNEVVKLKDKYANARKLQTFIAHSGCEYVTAENDNLDKNRYLILSVKNDNGRTYKKCRLWKDALMWKVDFKSDAESKACVIFKNCKPIFIYRREPEDRMNLRLENIIRVVT